MIEDVEHKLSHCLRNSNPKLFLGAGFSYGAQTRDDNPIPLGDDLKLMILKNILKLGPDDIEYQDLVQLSLSKVCEYVRLNKMETVLNDYLTYIFKHIKPANYHNCIKYYQWSRIYTTNIDDLIETIYADSQPELLSVNTNRQLAYRPKGDFIEYIKLHGDVNNSSQGYIFSADDYVTSMVNNLDYRFRILVEDLHYSDFIFIGTNFDEANIDYYLKLYQIAGQDTLKGSLFFITPAPGRLLIAKIKEAKGFLLKWTAEQFLYFLNDSAFHKNRDKNNGEKLAIQDFDYVNSIKSTTNLSTNYASQLYFGFDPTWQDILWGWDFRTKMAQDIIDAVLNRKYITGFFSIYGKALSGKSTLLKRVAVELTKQHFDVFYHQGTTLNVDAFINYVRKKRAQDNFALIVDNASFHYVTLKHIISKWPDDKRCAIITAARPYYHIKKRYYISSLALIDEFLTTQIDSTLALEIVNRLSQTGYLGILRGKSQREQIEYFMEKNDLVAALFELSHGSGYITRLNTELESILAKKDVEFNILLDLCIFYSCELPYYPKDLITLIYNRDVANVTEIFHDFVKTDRYGNLALRMQALSRNIFKHCTGQDVLESIKNILMNISSTISETHDTYSNQIFEALCKVRFFSRDFTKMTGIKIRYEALEQMLNDLRNYFGGHSYYWVQLGLAEQASGYYTNALNHFRQAQSIRPNSYMIQHAIGRNYLKEANSVSSKYEAESLFFEGEKIMLKLIKTKEEAQVKYHAIHCYLNEKIEFYRNYDIVPGNDELRYLFELLQKMSLNQNDPMSAQINNKFYRFLKSINRSGLFKMHLYDLEKFRSIFADFGDEFEIVYDDLD